MLVDNAAEPGLRLAGLSESVLAVLRKVECGAEPDAQPSGGPGFEAGPVRSHPDLLLTPMVLSSFREEDGLGLGRPETNGVLVHPSEACGSALLQLVGHVVDVNSLDDLGDVVDKGNASAILHLVFNRTVNLWNVECKEN